MKKLLSLTLSLLMLLSLPSCRKEEEPPVSSNSDGSQEQTGPSPYSDANTTDRYYLSRTGDTGGFVYGDNYYYCSGYCTIIASPLGEALKHNVITEGSIKYVQTYTSLCPDPLCKHSSVECPTMMRDPYAEFLIDAKESNGGQPVIYYFRATSETWEENGGMTVLDSEIIRFDVAEGAAKQVVFSDEPIKQLMSYGDYLYFTTATSDDMMDFRVVKKTGGEVKTLKPGNGYLRIIGANEQGAYANDDEGNVYKIDLTGEGFELIYTVPEVYPMFMAGPAELNMFTEGDYLYFYSDHEIGFTQGDWDMIKHSIRRVKLDAPSGEGEMVAESVFETSVYGVYNDVLYYGPFDVRVDLKGPEYAGSRYFSNGTIKGVNLTTLETCDVVTDSGFNFTFDEFYVNDRCIIGWMSPYRNFEYYRGNGAGEAMLYDFETGALYCLEVSPNILSKQ